MKFRIVAILVSILAWPESLWACSVCFGAADSPLIDGLRLSIVFLLILTYAVIAGFLFFFLYLRRRERLFTGTPETLLSADKGERN